MLWDFDICGPDFQGVVFLGRCWRCSRGAAAPSSGEAEARRHRLWHGGGAGAKRDGSSRHGTRGGRCSMGRHEA